MDKANVNEEKQPLAIEENEDDGISVPNWLVEVLAWISRMEMANSSLAFSCKTFKQLCWQKLHPPKPYSIPFICFHNELDEHGNPCAVMNKAEGVRLQIANCHPPEYITGLKCLKIYYLDGQILRFLEKIMHLLKNAELRVGMEIKEDNLENAQIGRLQHLVNTLMAGKSEFLYIYGKIDLAGFKRLFPAIFHDQIQTIIYRPEDKVSNPIDDNLTDFDVLLEWLTKKRREDGKPKYYIWPYTTETKENEFIERVKEQFARSIQPAPFMIKFDTIQYQPNRPLFEMENERTGEMMHIHNNGGEHLLVRLPKEEAELWNNEEYLNEKLGNIDCFIGVGIEAFGTFE